MQVYINGRLVDKEKATISVFDHGFLYGDGVFEGIRAYNNRVFYLDEHIDRLYNSAKSIMLNIPLKKEELKAAIIETLKVNKLSDAYIRVVVSRGVGDLGLDPQKCKKPTVIIITDKIQLYPPEMYEKGLEIITVSIRRNIPDALNPQLKSLNYLNNILAKIEVNLSGCLEGIMLNSQGYVAEATGDNIFIVKKKVLFTPPVYAGILEGITRNIVIKLAKEEGIETKEELFTQHDVYIAEECFLTGTAAELIPVVKLDGRIIGGGKPGNITKRLTKLFKELTHTTGVEIK